MYDIFKSVIQSRRFELSDMLRKIDTLWVQGNITDEQRGELINLARENADPEMSNDLAARIEDHEQRLRKLEESGTVPPPSEYPAFQPNRVYVKGDKVTFKGKKYICVLNEYTDKTTWSPEDYPAYWKQVD